MENAEKGVLCPSFCISTGALTAQFSQVLGRLSKSGDSSTLRERREFRRPVNADLFQHSELIPIVPALYNLSFVKTGNGDPCQADTLASSGNTKAVAAVRHRGGTWKSNSVFCSENVFDFDFYIRERSANLSDKRDKLLRTMKLHTRTSLSGWDSISGKQFVNGFDSAIIPHFLKPASHSLNILFDWHKRVLLLRDFSG